LVNSPEKAWEAAQDIGLPVAVKPYDGNHGRGVTLDLSDKASIEAAFHVAKEQSGGSVIVEKFIPGNEHRLLVVGKRVVAAARGEIRLGHRRWHQHRHRASDMRKSTPTRAAARLKNCPSTPIEPDKSPEVQLELRRAGLTPASVPAKDQQVLIQRNGNVALDVTDELHPTVAAAAALAARVVGLDIAGIDMVMEDMLQAHEEPTRRRDLR